VIALGGDCSRVCTGELGSVAAARRGVLVGLCLGLLEMRCVGSMGKTTRLPSKGERARCIGEAATVCAVRYWAGNTPVVEARGQMRVRWKPALARQGKGVREEPVLRQERQTDA
jgi:hypothetical protein